MPNLLQLAYKLLAPRFEGKSSTWRAFQATHHESGEYMQLKRLHIHLNNASIHRCDFRLCNTMQTKDWIEKSRYILRYSEPLVVSSSNHSRELRLD